MAEYTQHNKWQLMAVGGVLLSVYLVFGYIVPEFNNTLQIYDNWQKQEEKIASVSNWESRLDQLNNQQKELEAFFSKIYVSLPDDDQMSTIVNQVFSEAEAVGLKLNQMRPAERVEFESYVEIPMSVTLRGRFHEIGRFVSAIEQSGYLMKVDEIKIQTEQQAAVPLVGQILIKVIILKRKTEGDLNTDA